MFNALVEECFDKCVTVGWDGVRVGHVPSIIVNVFDIFVEFWEQSTYRERGKVHDTLHRENGKSNSTCWNAFY